jgi:hypothetical protein
MGVRGSFLPNYRIMTMIVDKKIKFFWQDIEDENMNGEIYFENIDSHEVRLTCILKDGGQE